MQLFFGSSILTLALLGAPALAQEPGAEQDTTETLADSWELNSDTTSVSGSLVFKITKLGDRTPTLLGARGGWLMGHHLYLGGYLDTSVSRMDSEVEGYNGEMEYDEIGLTIGATFGKDRLIHPNFLLHVGQGQLKVEDLEEENDFEDEFAVITPEINAEMNITTYFRISLGVAYRMTSGVDEKILSKKDTQAAAGVLAFNFGTRD
jgi:hypothetical protein